MYPGATSPPSDIDSTAAWPGARLRSPQVVLLVDERQVVVARDLVQVYHLHLPRRVHHRRLRSRRSSTWLPLLPLQMSLPADVWFSPKRQACTGPVHMSHTVRSPVSLCASNAHINHSSVNVISGSCNPVRLLCTRRSGKPVESGLR